MDTEMEFEAYSNLTNIQRFFYGQNVFLTGVTGFVGKVSSKFNHQVQSYYHSLKKK